MRVVLVGHHFETYIRDMFPDLDAMDSFRTITYLPDLVILSGGGDIHPSRYGQRITYSSGINRERDRLEYEALNFFHRIPENIKFLGICRGHQLLNVFFGGSLYQDMTAAGKKHNGPIHELSWLIKSPLSELFPSVNSIHHQGVNRLAGNGVVLATEPKSGIPEAIQFGNEGLGLQFHPEFMAESYYKKLATLMEEWAVGGESITGFSGGPSRGRRTRQSVPTVSMPTVMSSTGRQYRIITDRDGNIHYEEIVVNRDEEVTPASFTSSFTTTSTTTPEGFWREVGTPDSLPDLPEGEENVT